MVGALPGVVNVSEIGAATYSIPLQLPPGIKGMMPNLAITYNSMLGNGSLGWGWNISGLSAITRTRSTIYHDNFVDGINFDESDRFVMDGQRLMLYSGTYGMNDAQYRTEMDILARIVSYKSSWYNGAEKLKVWQKDGSIWYYGYTEDSRIEPQGQSGVVLTWLVNRIEDRQGNYIDFRYTENNSTGEFYINSIKYTGNERLQLQPFYEIIFNYTERIDKEFLFVGNFKVSQTKLLNEIIIKKIGTDSHIIRYEFIYRPPSSQTFYTRLNTIWCFDDNNQRLNPTTINWDLPSSSTVINMGTSSPINGIVFTGDFNGNGFTDLLVLPPKPSSGYNLSHQWRLYINDKNGNFTSTIITGNLSNGLQWIYVGDFNGDGKSDFLYIERSGGSLYIKPFIARINDLGFDQKNNIWFGSYLNTKEDILVGDFIGEGKSSFMVKRDGSTQKNWNYYVYNNDSESFQLIKENAVISSWGDDTYTADFNGDGKTDIMVVDNLVSRIYTLKRDNNQNLILSSYYYWGFPTKYHRVFTGDFNGDGKTDLLTYSPESSWLITFLTETGFHWPHIAIPQSTGFPQSDPGQYVNSLSSIHEARPYLIRLADFNGDGKTDIFILKKNGPVYTQHTVFYAPIQTDNTSNPFVRTYGDYGSLLNTNNQNLFVGDFNGNGCADVLGTCHVLDQNNTYPAVTYNFHPDEKQYMVSLITDGLSKTIGITYDYMTRTSNYTHPPNITPIGPVINAALTVRIVTQLSVDDVSNHPSITNFRYRGAKIHREGKGWLGFSWLSIYNNKEFIILAKNNDVMIGQYYLYPVDQITYLGDLPFEGNKLTHTFFDYQKAVSWVNPKIVIPQLLRSRKWIWEKPGVFLKTELNEFIYDNTVIQYPPIIYYNYNNFTQSATYVDHNQLSWYAANYKYRFKNVYNYHSANINEWLVSQIESVEKSTFDKDDTAPEIKSKTTYQYYAQGHINFPLLFKQSHLPNANQNDVFVTNNEINYDKAGNITNSKFSAPNYQPALSPRISNINYNAAYQYRFPTSFINPAGHESTSTYNPTYGWQLSSTDPNGLTTTYSHHSLGISLGTIYPDGIRQLNVLRWATGHADAPANALYYSWSQTSGQPEVITFFNKTGHELRSVTRGFDGTKIYQDKTYNYRGLLANASLPYHPGNEVSYTGFEYDALGRVTATTYPDNTTSTTQYLGATIKTTNPLYQTTEQKYNAAGWLEESKDPAGSIVKYDYFSDGKLKTTFIVGQGETTISLQYNSRRQRSVLNDPNYGSTQFFYNPFDELTKRISPKNQEFIYAYDVLGRLTGQTEPEGSTQWQYDAAPGRLGLLAGISANNHQIAYLYDNLYRLLSETETILTTNYTTTYSYDELSRPEIVTHPSGVGIRHQYNNSGLLQSIRSAANNQTLWQNNEVNAIGQITGFSTGNTLATIRSFHPKTARLETVHTKKPGQPPVQDLEYAWDNIGNLTQRKKWIVRANNSFLAESFTFDQLNRLNTIRLNGIITGSHTYDAQGLGNLSAKTANGALLYNNAVYGQGPAGPHALTSANTSLGIFPVQRQEILYNSFDKVTTVNEGDKTLGIVYGVHHQRIAQRYRHDQSQREKTWAGACEYINDNGTLLILTYLSGPEGVFALHIKTPNGTENICYIHKDHLGSWNTITDESGNLLQELSYDAWGSRRNPATWQPFAGTPPAPLFDRGFTGHEHLYAFNLINMNGRMYDPVLGRFLSPDPVLQFPDFTQGLNPYSYCLNNPLSFTDPSGYSIDKDALFINGGRISMSLFFTLVAITTPTPIGPIVLGIALINLFWETSMAMMKGARFSEAIKYGFASASIAAISAYGSAQIGVAFKKWIPQKGQLFFKELARAGVHGTFNGGLRAAQGGKFEHGFYSGFVYSNFAKRDSRFCLFAVMPRGKICELF
ncbi:MAG: FG-GAP-like repeat-containing protein [Bacteroidales bacterium]|nr:FG-GAP-like repeat-containing protein [Bacteroidales bacterium]